MLFFEALVQPKSRSLKKEHVYAETCQLICILLMYFFYFLESDAKEKKDKKHKKGNYVKLHHFLYRLFFEVCSLIVSTVY